MKISIRAATPEDASAIAAIYMPHVLSGTGSFESDPPDARAMRTRMAAGDGLYPWLVATNGDPAGGVIGYAYATRFRDRPAYRYVCETSIYMADVAQGDATSRLLYDALIDTLRAQGFVHALASIALPNDASIKIHESVGFRRAGVYREVGYQNHRWIDVGIWQVELNDAVSPPVEPKKFSEVGVVRDW